MLIESVDVIVISIAVIHVAFELLDI